MIGNRASRLRLEFAKLSLEQEEALTRVLYSRADSWLGWGEERERDRPFRSLLQIMQLSARAWASPRSDVASKKADALIRKRAGCGKGCQRCRLSDRDFAAWGWDGLAVARGHDAAASSVPSRRALISAPWATSKRSPCTEKKGRTRCALELPRHESRVPQHCTCGRSRNDCLRNNPV